MPWPRGRTRPPASGRRPGTPNRLTLELRGVVREALREAGGADYLAGIARDRPELFLPLVRRILPRGVDVTQLEEAAFVARAAEMLGRPAMAAQDAPGAAIPGPVSPDKPVSLGSAAALVRLLAAGSEGAPR